MEPDLLPCPFCGTSNVELVLSGDYEHWQVACMQEDCGNDGPEAQYKGTAVALWNTRKETTLILETITIGEYTIKNINPFGEIGNFWIENTTGEGFSVSSEKMRNSIDKFFKEEF